MKKFNMMFVMIVTILVVLAFVYFYIYPSQPWLEGFEDNTASILKNEAVGSLIFLNKAYKNKDLTGGMIEADMLTVSSCPKTGTTITKTCYNDMLNKYDINPESNVPVSDTNLSIDQARISLRVLRELKGIFGGIFNPSSSYEFITAIANDTVCSANKSKVNGYINPVCYNSLLKTHYRDVSPSIGISNVTSTPNAIEQMPMTGPPNVKDYRVGFFKNLSLVAGYTTIKTSQIEAVYDKMTSCKNASNEYDIDCFREMADEFDITISKEAMNSVDKIPTTTNASAESAIDSALKVLKDTKSAAADVKKCTVEFGKKPEISPQTGAAPAKTPDTTCVTTGEVVKDTKTPSVAQGCDFANKFPKVNVINLRDYVHKDEIPCWSCKL